MSDDAAESIVIYKAPWRLWTGVALGVFALVVQLGLFAFIAAVMGLNGIADWARDSPLSFFSMGFPLACSVLLLGAGVWDMQLKERLVLDAEGLRILTRERSRFVRWSDVKRFRTEVPKDGMAPEVGWDHHHDASDGSPRWEGNRWEGFRTSTLDVRLDTGWSLEAGPLAQTLEAWRVRHSSEHGRAAP